MKLRFILYLYLLLVWLHVCPVVSASSCVFTPIDATQGLSGNKVRSIAQLPDGRMMIMTEGQLNLFDGTDFSYLHYGREHFCPLSEYSGYHHTYIDGNGYMWIKNQYQLMVLDIDSQKFVVNPETLPVQWGIKGGLKDLFMDRNRNLWVITGGDSLYCVDGKTHKARFFRRRISLDGDQVYDLGMVDDRLYIFYRSGLLVCHDFHSGREIYRQGYPENLPSGLYGKTSYVVQGERCFYQLCNGVKGGVMLYYDIARKEWDVVMTTESRYNYLSIDRDGSLWVSSPEGLCHIDSGLKEKQYIPTLKLVDGRKIDTEVSTLYNDRQGGMWVGTLDRGILYYHPDRFRFRNIGRAAFPLSGGETMQVTGFGGEKDGNILVNTNCGQFLYNPHTGGVVCYSGALMKEEGCDSVPGIREEILQTDHIGNDLLAGITRHGWFIYDRVRKRLDFHSTVHSCNALCVDRQGNVWIGLEDGLLWWHKGAERMFYTDDGLVNNSVRSIVCTADGNIWISTANGISHLLVGKEGTCSFVNFNRFDGVIADEFSERAVYVSSEGILYWGGINGFNSLDPRSLVAGRDSYVPLFVGFRLFGERIESGKSYHGRVILEHPVTMTHSIILEHNQNFFTIEFTALNYINPTQTYYRYQLAGIDKTEQEFHSTDGKGYVTYTDLPSGDYVFRVRAAGNGKSWTGQYAELHICVKAPFWQTGYAYVFYFLLIVGCIVLSVMFYVRRKKRNLVREQKEKLDEMKTVFLQNMNQELKEPVERIMTPLDRLLKHTDEGRVKVQLQEISSQVMELKDLVGHLSEGVLLPLPTDEKTLDMDSLLIDMRRLLKQQEKRKEQLGKERMEGEGRKLLSEADEAFIRKALDFVGKNLDNPEYSVEVLSRDMGMDRTGLYRKLVAVVGKTPTNFIRSVRLKRAAQLLEEGYTVAEVADSVGFSTSSYLSKCFQEEFGVRPSQYVEQHKKR